MKRFFSVKKITIMSLFVSIISVCAWISFATVIPVTLQLFGVLIATYFLPTMCAVVTVLVYLLLGAVGVPVFSLFRGGISHLMGVTGGFLIGFLFTALLSGMLLKKYHKTFLGCVFSFSVGTFCCYIFGIVWYVFVSGGEFSFAGVLGACLSCVLPFVPFDLIKIFFAALFVRRFKRMRVKINE